jgi:predicted nucleic acid-binding protein
MLSGLQKGGRGIEIRDLLVGAAALKEGYAVAMENKEHFQRILSLTVLTEQELLRTR